MCLDAPKKFKRGDGQKKSGWGWKVFLKKRDKLTGIYHTPKGADRDSLREYYYVTDTWLQRRIDSPGFCLFTEKGSADRYAIWFDEAVVVHVRYRGALTSGNVDLIPHAITVAEIFIPEQGKISK